MIPNLRKIHLLCLIATVVLFFYGMQRLKKNRCANIKSHVIPILVLACNRPSVARCLRSILRYRPNSLKFPIIVSVDCDHQETYDVIRSFADADPSIAIVHQPDQSDIPRNMKVGNHLKGYFRIARHFKFALNHVFKSLNHKAAIIVEDDLEIAPDFFEYFLGTYHLLYKDPSIWCVSAWNDNCKAGLVEIDEPELLHRTDFFPGMGWMVLSKTWDELEKIWPEAYFDDWLRKPEISRGRVCIRPEISRTFNFGRFGVSSVKGFDRHLRYTILNKVFIPFTSYDLSYLHKKYERLFFTFVYSQPEVADVQVMDGSLNSSMHIVRVSYHNVASYMKSAKMFGLMYDMRHGVPRTGLRGIVQAYIKGRRVFLAPERKNNPYKIRNGLYRNLGNISNLKKNVLEFAQVY